MPPDAALELRPGEPRWYLATVGLAYTAVLVSLSIAPLKWPYTLVALILGAVLLFRELSRQARGRRIIGLRVHADYSLTVSGRDGDEVPARLAGGPWVSPWLIVLPLELSSGATERIVVSRDQNTCDAFRRFTVLCRFGFAVDGREGQNVHDPNTNTTGA